MVVSPVAKLMADYLLIQGSLESSYPVQSQPVDNAKISYTSGTRREKKKQRAHGGKTSFSEHY